MSVDKWLVVERSDTFNVKHRNRCIARVQKKIGAEQDARLIAKAPEMHAALRAFVEAMGGPDASIVAVEDALVLAKSALGEDGDG